MRLSDALIAWSPGTRRVRVDPVPQPGQIGWTAWPAAYARKRRGAEVADVRALVTEIVADGVPAAEVHGAFMLIAEYRELPDEAWARQ